MTSNRPNRLYIFPCSLATNHTFSGSARSILPCNCEELSGIAQFKGPRSFSLSPPVQVDVDDNNLPNMEMRDPHLVFSVVLVCVILPLSLVDSKYTRCTQTSDCDSAVEFCDTRATRTCMSCGDFPCLASYVQEQGDGWCRKVCPDYWQNHVKSTTVASLAFTETKPQEPKTQKFIEDNGEEAEIKLKKSTTDVDKVLFTCLGVLIAVVLVVCGIIAGRKVWVCYRRKYARPFQEEGRRGRDMFHAGHEAGPRGPILEEQGGL